MRKVFSTIAVLLLSFTVSAQAIDDVNNLVSDLVELSKSYIQPAAEGVAHQTTNGWFTNADIESPWAITASVQGSLLFIPNKRRTFLIDESNYQNLRIQGSGTTALSPTAIGGDNVVTLEGNIGDDTFEFTSPEGINESTVNHFQFQIGVTLPYHTEFIARYSPKIKISDTFYQTYGFGLHHSLSQWFNRPENSTWSFSTLIYYTKFTLEDTFSNIDFILGDVNGIEADNNAFGFNLISSKHLGKFTLSGALNLTLNSFDYAIRGEGDFLLDILNNATESLDNSKTFVSGNIGVDYKLKNFTAFTSLAVGRFQNLILGFNYTFNTKPKS